MVFLAIMCKRLFKVLAAELWKDAESAGAYSGSGIDLTDGFIHLSTDEQVVETARLHFAGQTDLLLVEIDGERLGETLRWESSRGDDLFPHVYGDIPMDSVIQVDPLPLGEDGSHQFPQHLFGD